jgi:hypothetical protein
MPKYRKPLRPQNRLIAVQARLAAKRVGLFVLFEGDPRSPKGEYWRFSCANTGKYLLTFWPKSRAFRFGHRRGKCRNWFAAVQLAVAVRDGKA